MLARLSSFVLIGSLVLAATAHAQNIPPDVVQLTNGGMVRGTILENIPNDHLTIQLATGETRRFGPGEVRSAGPAAPPPAAPPASNAPVMGAPTASTQVAPVQVAPAQVPPAPPGYGQTPPGYAQAPQLNPDLVTLRVSSATQGVTLHRMTGTANVSAWTGRGMAYGRIDSFEPICTAPCAVQIPRGTYTLGLSQGEGQPRRAGHAMFTAMQDTNMVLEYESREGIRIGGWVIFTLASLGYLASAFAITDTNGLTIFAVASVLYLVALIPSFIMIYMNDHADVRDAGPAPTAPPSGQF